MSCLGNILWLLSGGVVCFISYMGTGVILCSTILLIPVGVKFFKIAIFSLLPFGKQIVKSDNMKTLSLVLNIIWFPAGLVMGLVPLLIALLHAITIIGIPFAIQDIKLFKLTLAPFGKEIRPIKRDPADRESGNVASNDI